MARNDDILLDTTAFDALDPKDTDGDGVSDAQERLDGTNPDDASDHLKIDPKLDPTGTSQTHAGIDPAALERDTVFNPTAPAGQSVEGGLSGLTNVDGTAFQAGPQHHGVAEFDAALLEGHTPGNSPLDIQRDPTASVAMPTAPQQAQGGVVGGGTFSAAGGGGAESAPAGGEASFTSSKSGGSQGAGPPPGQAPSGSADPTNSMSLVSDDGEGHAHSSAGDLKGLFTGAEDAKNAAADAGTKADPGANLKSKEVSDATKEAAKKWQENNKGKDTNPDADPGNAAPTQDQLEHTVTMHGATTHTVDGVAAGPQIEGGPPPAGTPHNPLVTDPSGDGDPLGVVPHVGSGTPPVITTSSPDVVNPHDGFAPPVIAGGSTHGGNTGQQGQEEGGDHPVSGASADTASYAAPGSAGSSGVTDIGDGNGSSGIHSVDASQSTDASQSSDSSDATVDAGGMGRPDAQDITVLGDHAAGALPSTLHSSDPAADSTDPTDAGATNPHTPGDDDGTIVNDQPAPQLDGSDGGDGGSDVSDGSGDPVDTFATSFLADAPDDAAIIIPDVDHSAALAPLEPMDHVSFVDQGVDDGGDAPPATDLFGNDDTLDG